MKVFFQIKFSITAKEETQIEEELSNYVLTWLESKYGVAAKRAISACKSLLSDSEFGDPNGLFVETVHYEDVKYAVSIEASIQQLLIKTRELLSSCNCDSACHKCLKHYRNQYVHGLLDRSAALDLLTWAEKGVRSPMLPVYEQRNSLQSVEQILQFSGVHIDFDHEPIEAESFHGKKRIVVYPAMWARPTEKNMVFVSDSYLKYAKPYALKTIVGGL